MRDATLTETVTIPADVALDAAALLQAVDRVATIVNHDTDPPDELTGSFGGEADRLMDAAFPTGDLDIDKVAEWREFLARRHERAADLIETILAQGGPIVGRILGLEQWHADREREWAARDRSEEAVG